MFLRRRKPDDFVDEIRAHLALEYDHLRAQGLGEEEAWAAARRTFGNVTHAGERFYDAGRWAWLDSVGQNVRFGLRTLRRSPASSALAIFALGLGIGANTAIFSLFHAVLLRSLPVPAADELRLFGKGEWVGSVTGLPNRSWQLFSYRQFREFEKNNPVFSDVAAVSSVLYSTHGRVAGGANLERIRAELVSGTYFRTLGLAAMEGRVLAPGDDVYPGGHPVAVASHAWWSRRLGANRAAVGTKVAIGGTVYSIVGVAPAGFSGVTLEQAPDLWIPLAMQKQISPGWHGLEKDLFQSLYVFARLKPGIGAEQAGANTNLRFRQILSGFTASQPSAKQKQDIAHASIELTSLATGLSHLRRQFASPLQILMCVVGLVLLIACANVANLLLARATARQREIAIRMSIGASRHRLIQQLLTESAMLGLFGTTLGVLAAWATTELLVGMVSGGTERLPIRVGPDLPVLGFTLLVAFLTVLLFGLVPALRATRLQLASSLKAGRGTAAGLRRNRLAGGLIAGQVALSLALLCGAGLFLRSLVNLQRVDTGFDQRRVLVTSIDAVGAGYQNDVRLRGLMEQVEARTARIPGIRAASFAFMVFGGGWTNPVKVPGRVESGHDPDVAHNIVGSGYLKAMGMPVILGRNLSERDQKGSRKVAVINETMARAYFGPGSPVGRTFSMGDGADFRNVEVVGVVRDAKYMELVEDPMPAAFYPHAQHPGFLYQFVAGSDGDPARLTTEIRKAVASVDPNVAVGDFSTLADLIDGSIAKQRLVAQLSTLFAVLATMLACFGIYGVMSYGIARRINEIGVRMALGAQRRQVLWMVLGETLRLALAGAAVGIGLTVAVSGLVQQVLFGLTATDPLAIGTATVLMLGVALLAAWLPARRATRIDPLSALRYE